jgi:hypothetical protein
MDNTENSEQPEARRSLHAVVGPHVEWEIVLSGGHPDIFVIVSAPENATDVELQRLAETEAMAKTYIWSKKRVQPNEKLCREAGQKDTR